jgi:xanthine dehydrogenase YagR molybdenum-binding subunit
MYLGQGVIRQDGLLKVTGSARYAAEFNVPDCLHAVLVQSTIPAGTITGLDTAQAEHMPGVVAILTHKNAGKLNQSKAAQQTVTHPFLQDERIFYNGQHVAVAIADTFERADAAAAAIRVQYAPSSAVTVMDESQLSRAYKPKKFQNGEKSPDVSRGDAQSAFAAAPVKLEATYETPVEHHNPMEPHATIASWNGDKLTIWTATQGISGAQETLASAFGLPQESVTIICPYVGGGFGCKGNTWPPAVIAAQAARHVQRPVKLVVTRPQMFTSNGYRPKTIQKIKLGAGTDGKLHAIEHDGFSQMSDPALGEFCEPVAVATEMAYSCKNLSVSHRVVPVNQGLPTYMRAPGESSGMFALESAMDEMAHALRMDPLAFRLANYAERDEQEDKPFASKGLRQCYSHAAEKFGWSRRDHTPGSMRDGRILVGWGMATSTYPTNRRPCQARIQMNPDGTVLVQSGVQDLGTGTYTIMAQCAADMLGVEITKVTAELGDSRFPPGPVSGGSATAASVIPAIVAAVDALRAKVATLANFDPRLAGLAPADFKLEGFDLVAPGRRVPLKQIMQRAGVNYIEAVGSAAPGAAFKAHSCHAFGAQFAEVRIDPDFGTIRVSRMVSCFEVGRLLNARTGRSQLLGGIVFGIGMALQEETLIDRASGRIVNANIADYHIPVNADIPDIEVMTVDAPDLATGALGAKGTGELPMVGVAPAIANAVFHATGKRVRTLPIRVEDVLASA